MLESCLSQSFLTTTDKIARQMSSQPSIDDQCYNWNFLGTVIVDEKRYLIPLSVLQAHRSSVASSNKWTIVRDVEINKSNALLHIFLPTSLETYISEVALSLQIHTSRFIFLAFSPLQSKQTKLPTALHMNFYGCLFWW